MPRPRCNIIASSSEREHFMNTRPLHNKLRTSMKSAADYWKI